MTYAYEFARPALTVDVVVFALDEPDLQVMLIQRDLVPYRGDWALPGGFVRLPEKFTLRQLQHLYEIVLDRPLDKRNFRKKVLGMGVIKETSEIETDVAHRAARLFRFDKKAYDRLTKRGFNFEI